MITIKMLKAEIEKIKHQIENEEMKPAAETRLRNRIKFLNQCILYIETNPPEHFVKSEIVRLDKFISTKLNAFPAERYKDLCNKDFNKMKKEHEKMFDIPKLRIQLKTLKFLLAA
jgi:hypothetical protein